MWLALGAIFLTAVTLLCAHAPARIRLLGLFAVAYGLFSGYALKHLARIVALRQAGAIIALTFVAVAAGQSALTLESYRIAAAAHASEMQRELESDKSRAALALILQSSAPPADSQARQMFDEMQETLGIRMSFANYLARRFSTLGQWSSPWPEIFWSVEILMSAAAGAWMASRPMKTGKSPSGDV